MNDLYERFIKFIDFNSVFGKNEKILLAVSGGMDSMVMATLFSEAGFNFAIAHCNFSMRGDESDGDELAVKNLAASLSVEIHTQKFNTASFAGENKLSIQEAARILRYKMFDELCNLNGYDKIATAHHHDDSIETFFINLMRGSGPAGLRGIPLKNKNIIRPLLFATRKEIYDYAKSEKVLYRTDSSNETDDYLRNRIRHHLMPVLNSLVPDLDKKFTTAFENISFIHEFAMHSIEAWKKTNAKVKDNGEIHLSLETINSENDPVQFLSFLLYSFGITDVDCRQILEHKEPGGIFNSLRFEILRDREFIILRQKRKKIYPAVQVNELPSSVQAGGKDIRFTVKAAQPFEGNDNNLQQVDADKITIPLIIRTWKQGDYFYPLGMKGRKKVSDYFIDKKLNLFEKENAFLLLSGMDIVCILGHRIDDRYKVTPETRKILNIELL